MRKSVFIYLFLFVGMALYGQTADDLLKDAFKKINAAEHVTYSFQFEQSFPEGMNNVTQGKLLQHKTALKLYWDKMWLLRDDASTYLFDPDLNEIQIYNKEEGPSLPFSIEYLENLLEEDLIYDITGTNQFNNKKVYEIEFKPTKDFASEASFFKLRLALNQSDGLPAYFSIFNQDGSKQKIIFDAVELNKTISPKEFTFNKADYPNVSIEDLRL